MFLGFNYAHFLEPLLSYQEFKGLYIDEFSLIKSCNEMITRVNEQKDICMEALNGKNGYDTDELHSLQPYLDMLIAEWDISFDHKTCLEFLNGITTYYTNHPEHVELFELHRNYISKTHTAIQTQIVLIISILQGLFHYKEIKPWYSQSLPLLKKEDSRLIPFYVYTTLELLCRKHILTRENTICTAINLFQENKKIVYKTFTIFEPLFTD